MPTATLNSFEIKPLDSPEHAAAAAKRDDIRGQIRKLEARRDELNGHLSDHHNGATHENQVTANARRLLDGEAIPPSTLQSTRDELQGVYRQLPVLREALRIQEQRVSQAVYEASKSYAEELRDQYSNIVQDVAAALDALESAMAAEIEFREAVNNSEWKIFPGNLAPVPFPIFGDMIDGELRFQVIDQWRAESRAAGYIA